MQPGADDRQVCGVLVHAGGGRAERHGASVIPLPIKWHGLPTDWAVDDGRDAAKTRAFLECKVELELDCGRQTQVQAEIHLRGRYGGILYDSREPEMIINIYTKRKCFEWSFVGFYAFLFFIRHLSKFRLLYFHFLVGFALI